MDTKEYVNGPHHERVEFAKWFRAVVMLKPSQFADAGLVMQRFDLHCANSAKTWSQLVDYVKEHLPKRVIFMEIPQRYMWPEGPHIHYARRH